MHRVANIGQCSYSPRRSISFKMNKMTVARQLLDYIAGAWS